MILESISTFIKTLPEWLMHVAEVMIVAILFLTAMTFLAGIWCGMRLIGNKAHQIISIELIPPKITFREKQDK